MRSGAPQEGDSGYRLGRLHLEGILIMIVFFCISRGVGKILAKILAAISLV
jgi:hypothetical protein